MLRSAGIAADSVQNNDKSDMSRRAHMVGDDRLDKRNLQTVDLLPSDVSVFDVRLTALGYSEPAGFSTIGHGTRALALGVSWWNCAQS
jgi:hypothetical protein